MVLLVHLRKDRLPFLSPLSSAELITEFCRVKNEFQTGHVQETLG